MHASTMLRVVDSDANDHMWDEVVATVISDARAYWGTWASNIAPILGPNVPHVYEEAINWTVDNVNYQFVVFKWKQLARRLKALLDMNTLHIANSRVSYHFEKEITRIISIDDDSATESDLKACVVSIVSRATIPSIIYPEMID